MTHKKHARRKGSLVGDMVTTGMGNIVGVGLIGATSSMANALPAGTAKTLTGTAVGLQGVAMLGPNLKLAKKSMKGFW